MNNHKNWLTCTMQAVSNVYNGNSISETEKAHEFTNLKSGYNYISTKDINFDATIDYNNGLKIPFIRKDFKIAPKNTPLLCIEGGSAGRKLGFLTEDVCFGNKLCAFVSPFSKWIYYYLQSDNFQNYFKFNRNGLIGGVSINKLKKALIPVPPLAEQKRIVKKIEELFGVIDEQVKRLEATQEALVSYRQSILHSLFSSAIGEKVPLEKCLNYLQPTPYIVKSTDYMEAGEVPVLTPGKTFILGFTKEKEGIFTNPLPVIIFDDFTTSTKLVDFPFKVKSSAMKILLAKEGVDIRYIYYIMQILSCPHDTHKRYWISIYAKMRIILPSLSEQKAIVKKIENAFAFADKAQAAIIGALEQAKQLKQSILKRAFEGKLVPQDPNDKPVDLTQLKKDKQK